MGIVGGQAVFRAQDAGEVAQRAGFGAKDAAQLAAEARAALAAETLDDKETAAKLRRLTRDFAWTRVDALADAQAALAP